MTKILLDTDIGTNIDDAVCLVYLLSHPECELVGITTVTGEPEKRAMMASALCRAARKDTPIYPGASVPMVVAQKQTHAAQAEALGRWDHETRFPEGEAVEFLRRTIRAHPHEIILLTIAPLTNIGLLLSLDPEIPSLLKGLVMMCGRFGGPVQGTYGATEWNASGDPHATAIVYRSQVQMHRSVGLDVTSWVTMGAREFRDAFRPYARCRPLLDFAEIWFRERKGTTFHDPLAAATIFEPALCEFRRGRVDVDLSGTELMGKTTFWEGKADGPHEIAAVVEPARFFDHYFSILA